MRWEITGSKYMDRTQGEHMKTIGNLLSRDLSRKIEEIIQVDQTDEQSVYSEITEYIATDSIRDQYAALLKAVAEAPTEPMKASGLGFRFFRSARAHSQRISGMRWKNRRVLLTGFLGPVQQQIRVSRSVICSTYQIPALSNRGLLFDIARTGHSSRHTTHRRVYLHRPAQRTRLRRDSHRGT